MATGNEFEARNMSVLHLHLGKARLSPLKVLTEEIVNRTPVLNLDEASSRRRRLQNVQPWFRRMEYAFDRHMCTDQDPA
jgi:hypothetical protein